MPHHVCLTLVFSLFVSVHCAFLTPFVTKLSQSVRLTLSVSLGVSHSVCLTLILSLGASHSVCLTLFLSLGFVSLGVSVV